eukprot:3963025-Amphidinium_carterae.1
MKSRLPHVQYATGTRENSYWHNHHFRRNVKIGPLMLQSLGFESFAARDGLFDTRCGHSA